MSKARKHLASVRPDLVAYESDNVQARLTISICDDTGKPQANDRFFVVTAKVGRQVTMGRYNDGKPILQDRANPQPMFDAWNFETDDKGLLHPLGRQSVRVLIENPDIEDAYKVGCRCQKAPAQPSAPGKKPFCQTWDSVTATRWDGQSFIQINCLGEACPLRKEPPMQNNKRQPTPAKTQFKLVARLDEENFPQLLITECTGSDVNLANFASLIEQIEAKWSTLCKTAGFDIPLSWYAIPVRMTIYPHSGDNTRSPRIDYTLDCDIREVFTRRVEFQKRMSGYGSMLLSGGGRPLELTAGQLITEEMDDLDAVEVLHLDPVVIPDVPTPSRMAPVVTTPERVEAATAPASVVSAPERVEAATPPAPVVSAPAAVVSPVVYDFKNAGDLKDQITAALQNGHLDTIAGLLDATAAKCAAKPDKAPNMAKAWSVFAPSIHESHPGLTERLTLIGCPKPAPAPVAPPVVDAEFEDQSTPDDAPPFILFAPISVPPVVTAPARTPMEAVEDFGRQLMASKDKDAAYFFRLLITEHRDLPPIARQRWDAIRRERLAK